MSHLSSWVGSALALVLAIAVRPAAAAEASSADASAQAATTTAATRIDWFDGDVDAAFAAAREQNKPLFLYWGARWCPYCAQLESSVFVREEFVALSRRLIAVHIDGDAANAEALSERFKVRGYPTTLLFSASGEELSRLPAGTLQVEVYLEALNLALSSGLSIKQHVQDLLDENKTLEDADWIRLARYAWYSDQQQALGARSRAATLLALAERCPERLGEPCRTLKLNALAESGYDGSMTSVAPTMVPLLHAVLSSPEQIREQSDFLSSEAGSVLAALATAVPAQADELRSQWRAALERLAGDEQLSPRERLLSQIALIDIDREATGEVPESLIHSTRALVADASARSSDPLARQAVVGAAAKALISIGDSAAGEALLESALPDSRAAYYLMGALAYYAGQRGDAETQWRWERRAFEDGARSDLPRARLRTASNYLRYLIANQPQQRAEILEVGAAFASSYELNFGGKFWLVAFAGLVVTAFAATLISVSGSRMRSFTRLVLVVALAWIPVSIALAMNLELNFVRDLGSIWLAAFAGLLIAVFVALFAAIGARIVSCFTAVWRAKRKP